jgi:glycosyltransferase involved in cell wall biosynthesis
VTPAPLVSVVIPAWNCEGTLLRTLQSVAAQTYSNLEIIIVDDGSTDNTAAIAQDFCKSESRASLFKTENHGVSAARNLGVAEAAGDWIAPVDGDDVWHPTKIEKQIRAAVESPEPRPVGFVYCWHRQIDGEGCVLSSGPRLRLTGRVFHQFAYMNPVENGSAPLFFRNALVAVGGYDEDLPPYEDPMVQLRIADRFPIAIVAEHLVGWRRHEANASNDVDAISTRGRAMYRRLRAEGANLPKCVSRWVSARAALDTAEQRFAARRPLAGVAWVGKSLWGDPLRNTLQLLHRSGRIGMKRLVGRALSRRKPLFADVNPAAEFASDAHAIPTLVRLIERLDHRRLRRLARLDEKLPRSGGGKLVREAPGIYISDADSG